MGCEVELARGHTQACLFLFHVVFFLVQEEVHTHRSVVIYAHIYITIANQSINHPVHRISRILTIKIVIFIRLN